MDREKCNITAAQIFKLKKGVKAKRPKKSVWIPGAGGAPPA